MDYFAYFSLPRQFFPDLELLRKKFLAKSREHHPDFHSLATNDQQEEADYLSGQTNKAYSILKDFNSRLVHILTLEGLYDEGESPSLAPEFLMEMMDLNEELMELQCDPEEARKEEFAAKIKGLSDLLLEKALPVMKAFDEGKTADLKQIKDYYLKQKYLKRLLQNLENAPPA